jgi:hypothetical protein
MSFWKWLWRLVNYGEDIGSAEILRKYPAPGPLPASPPTPNPLPGVKLGALVCKIWLVRDIHSHWHKVVVYDKPKATLEEYVMGPFPTEKHAEELADRMNESSTLHSPTPYGTKVDSNDAEKTGVNWRSIDDE